MLMVTWTNRVQNEAIVATYNLSDPDPQPEDHLTHTVTNGWIDSVSIHCGCGNLVLAQKPSSFFIILV